MKSSGDFAFGIGVALASAILYCALLALACWPAGALPFAADVAWIFARLWLGTLVAMLIYMLIVRLFRLDPLDHFPVVLVLSIVPPILLGVLWAASMSLTVYRHLPASTSVGAVGLFAAGTLGCIPAIWSIASAHDGQASRAIQMVLIPLAWLVFAVAPGLAEIFAGWLM